MSGGDTVDFRNRLLLWHRALAQMTGTLSLSYGGKGVSRAAMKEWASRLRIVAADMESITGVENSRLDRAGRDKLLYVASTAPLAHEGPKSEKFFGKRQEASHGPAGVKASEKSKAKSETLRSRQPSPPVPKIEGRAFVSKPLKKATRRVKT